MARLTQAPGAAINRSGIDVASTELGHVLQQLTKTLLHADGDRERRLRTSEFERARVAANVDYARTSLTKLEQDALGIKAPGRRAEVQSDLNRKREVVELLQDRLEDFRQMALHDEDEDDDSSEGEDLLAEFIPTPSDSMADSGSINVPTETSSQDENEELEITEPIPPRPQPAQSVPTPTSPPPPQFAPEPTAQAEATQTTQEIRPRGAGQHVTSDAPAHTTARAALFANRRKPASPQTSTATAEAILDHQRVEQDALQEAILNKARELKISAQRFSSTLESDKDVVGRAGEGIDKTERGMEAARGRMGTLQKMTEGKGWWGRVILYAWVYGLMVALVLLVFVLPKLRF